MDARRESVGERARVIGGIIVSTFAVAWTVIGVVSLGRRWLAKVS